MLTKHHRKDPEIKKILGQIEETEGTIQIASGQQRVILNDKLATLKVNLDLRKHAINKELSNQQTVST